MKSRASIFPLFYIFQLGKVMAVSKMHYAIRVLCPGGSDKRTDNTIISYPPCVMHTNAQTNLFRNSRSNEAAPSEAVHGHRVCQEAGVLSRTVASKKNIRWISHCAQTVDYSGGSRRALVPISFIFTQL